MLNPSKVRPSLSCYDSVLLRTAQEASNLETVASVDLDQDAPIQETQESLGRYRDASSPGTQESQSRDQDALTPEKQEPLSRDQEGVLAFLRNNNLSTDPTDSSVDPSSPEGLVNPSYAEGLVDPTSLEVSIDPISSDSSADLSSLEVSANNFEDGSIQELDSFQPRKQNYNLIYTNSSLYPESSFYARRKKLRFGEMRGREDYRWSFSTYKIGQVPLVFKFNNVNVYVVY